MHAFRIVKRKNAAEAFTGEGARLHGGRWNARGTPMVYCAQTRALAALESLGHYHGEERRLEFVVFEIEIPDELVQRLDVRTLPADWRSPEPRAATQQLGSRWQQGGSSVALLVPSVQIPQESCVLLNPEHADTRRVQISRPVQFRFDGRL